MKFISWNVNGFRAVLKKGFEDVFKDLDADFFCLQETKMQEGQADFHPEGYHEYYNYADKKGYSGTAILQRKRLSGSHTELRASTTTKDVLSHWSMTTSISSARTYLIHRMS